MNKAPSVFVVMLLIWGVCLMTLPNEVSAFYEKFQKRYDIGSGPAADHKFNARPTFDNGIVAAFVQRLGFPDSRLFVMKTDSCGILQDQLQYELTGSASESFSTAPIVIYELVSGYVIAGTINNVSSACNSIFIMKIQYDGTVDWFKRFGTGAT